MNFAGTGGAVMTTGVHVTPYFGYTESPITLSVSSSVSCTPAAPELSVGLSAPNVNFLGGSPPSYENVVLTATASAPFESDCEATITGTPPPGSTQPPHTDKVFITGSKVDTGFENF